MDPSYHYRKLHLEQQHLAGGGGVAGVFIKLRIPHYNAAFGLLLYIGSARCDCQVDPQGGVTYQDDMVERDGKREEQGQSWQEAGAIYDVGHVWKQRL